MDPMKRVIIVRFLSPLSTYTYSLLSVRYSDEAENTISGRRSDIYIYIYIPGVSIVRVSTAEIHARHRENATFYVRLIGKFGTVADNRFLAPGGRTYVPGARTYLRDVELTRPIDNVDAKSCLSRFTGGTVHHRGFSMPGQHHCVMSC